MVSAPMLKMVETENNEHSTMCSMLHTLEDEKYGKLHF